MAYDDDVIAFMKVMGIKVSQEWNDFVSGIKGKNRFFHSELFEQYMELLCEFREPILTTQHFYRARTLNAETYHKMGLSSFNDASNDSGIHGLSKNEMGAPPKGKASAGRANPHGISYLYLATKPETACAELRPTLFDLISVAEFRLVDAITVINLKRINVSEKTEQEKTICTNVILEAMKAFSMPNRVQSDLEYAASQYLSAYFQHKGFDGIMYGSMSAMDDKESFSYNLVLFEPKKASCISKKSTVYRFAQRQMTFQNVSVLNEETCQAIATPGLFTTDDIKKLGEDLKKTQGALTT